MSSEHVIRNEILVRDGKAAKDAITMLPESLKDPLQEHLKKVKATHERDQADGCGRVPFPSASTLTERRSEWVHHMDKSIL